MGVVAVNLSLNSLLLDIKNGKTCLPAFQREWVWDDARIISILSSVAQGFPMGAVTFLDYDPSSFRIGYKPISGLDKPLLPATAHPNELILDGQQRLTSLYLALFSKKPVHTKSYTGKAIDRFYYFSLDACRGFSQRDSFADPERLIVSVPEDRIVKNFQKEVVLDVSSAEKEYAAHLVPANIIFSVSGFSKWMTGYCQLHSSDQESLSLMDDFIDGIQSAFTLYQVPVIQIPSGTAMEQVCKIFENINRGGVPLTAFELITAIYAGEDASFDLPKLWKDAYRPRLAESAKIKVLEKVSPMDFLTTATLYSNYNAKVSGRIKTVSCRREDVLRLSLSDFKENVQTVLDGYDKAAQFLSVHQHISSSDAVPYISQIIPLAAICSCIDWTTFNKPDTIAILSKWYWCGVFGELYGSTLTTRYAMDIEDVMDELSGKESRNRTITASNFSSIRLLSLQGKFSAAYKGIMALLLKHNCYDFMHDFSMYALITSGKSYDIHHIFPVDYCKRSGITKQRYNCVINKTPLCHPTNVVIGGRAPSAYLEKVKAKSHGLTDDELRRRIESCLIDYDLLAADDFDSYFIARAKAILDMIEKATGKEVTDRDSALTIAQFGASLSDNTPPPPKLTFLRHNSRVASQEWKNHSTVRFYFEARKKQGTVSVLCFTFVFCFCYTQCKGR